MDSELFPPAAENLITAPALLSNRTSASALKPVNLKLKLLGDPTLKR